MATDTVSQQIPPVDTTQPKSKKKKRKPKAKPQANGQAEDEELDNGDHESAGEEEVVNGNEDANHNEDTRFDDAVRERDQLRVEVTELRKSLEDIQKKHEEDILKTTSELESSKQAKEHAEGRYHRLLEQVNVIKTRLNERLTSDAEELSRAREQIEELETRRATDEDEKKLLQKQKSDLNATVEKQEQEIQELRGRTNLSHKNWAKERDDLVMREAKAREDFEAARQGMQDWEVLALEERSLREGQQDRIAEIEDQLAGQNEAYERAAAERDAQSLTVDGLQRALQEIQDGESTCVLTNEARKQELREVVETTQTQMEELRKQLKAAEDSSSTAQASLETTRQELERAAPFEKEVKEKNLLIGKLRHEAVILSDHLTKALRYLKKGKSEDTIDRYAFDVLKLMRQLVTNHFLHFLQLDRSDVKKFEILNLIAMLLDWTEGKSSGDLANVRAKGVCRPCTAWCFHANNESSARVETAGASCLSTYIVFRVSG